MLNVRFYRVLQFSGINLKVLKDFAELSIFHHFFSKMIHQIMIFPIDFATTGEHASFSCTFFCGNFVRADGLVVGRHSDGVRISIIWVVPN